MNTHKFQLAAIVAGIVAAFAILAALATLEASARDARETVTDYAGLCGDICRGDTDPDDYAPRVVDPAEACEPGEPAILGDDC